MSDFLQDLVARFTGTEPASRPRLPSLFEPLVANHSTLPSTPVDAVQVSPMAVDPTPVDPTPVDPMPVDPMPVDPMPVDPTPVDPTPVSPVPVNQISRKTVSAQLPATEAVSMPRNANLDSPLRGVGDVQRRVETAARPTASVPPNTREPIVSQTRSKVIPESRESEPAVANDARAPSSPVRPERAVKAISESREERTIFVPIETTQVRQTPKMSLAAPRLLPEQARPPVPQPAESDASPTRSRAYAETPSPVSPRQQAHAELPLASGELEFARTMAALKPPVTESPFSAPRASDARRADRPLAGFTDVPTFASVEPKTAPVPRPTARTMALTTPRGEAQRFERVLQERAPAAPPTINVTIGRVEITATPAPTTPRPTRKTSPVMTLDAYLRQSTGGGA